MDVAKVNNHTRSKHFDAYPFGTVQGVRRPPGKLYNSQLSLRVCLWGAHIVSFAFSSDPVQIAALANRGQRIFRKTVLPSPFPDHWTNVLPECVAQAFLGIHQRTALLK